MQARTHRDIGDFDRNIAQLRRHLDMLRVRPACPRARLARASPSERGARAGEVGTGGAAGED